MKKRKRVEKSQVLVKNDIFNNFYFSLSRNNGLRVKKIEKKMLILFYIIVIYFL